MTVNGYIIKAQGYDPGPPFQFKKDAVASIRKACVEDLAACRRKFGTAVLKRFKDTVWTVQALMDDHGPMWSRYSIHEA
jgi:hypothetical protein